MSSQPTTPPENEPFRGLAYYAEEDAQWFFGRPTDRRRIIGNVRAARLTLLYAESGVGKSSLLRAGVAFRLHEQAKRNAQRGSPKFVPVVFSAWRDDPVADLMAAVEREANAFMPPDRPLGLPRESLEGAIKAAAKALDATFLIILDQFEEHFGYRRLAAHPEQLADELAKCISDPQGGANFLIAIREDSYARLGELFAGQKINVYGNYLHLEYLSRAAGREAIEGPVHRYTEIHPDRPMEVEEDLIKAVLDEVQRGTLVLGRGSSNGGSALTGPNGAADEVEAPFLQLVMTRLWQAERDLGSSQLRKQTLDDLGGAEKIVRTHLDDALATLQKDELEAAADIFHDLVTPSGAKVAHTVGDLATMTGRPRDTVAKVLGQLDDARIVRGVDPAPGSHEQRYEIYHDRLALPLLEWSSARIKARLSRLRRRANFFRGLAIVAGALLLVAAVIAWTQRSAAEKQRSNAVQARNAARSLELAANAQANIGTDPQLSTLLALQALAVRQTPQAGAALRNALPELREQTTLVAGSPLTSAAFSPDGRTVVTAGSDGTALIWSATGRRIAALRVPGGSGLTSAAFSPDGREVVTASADGTARIWSVADGTTIRVLKAPSSAGCPAGLTSAAFSPDRREVVTAGSDGTARIWSAADGTTIQVLTVPPGAGSLCGPVLTSAAFSPDGRDVVTAGSDGAARIWSTTNGAQLRWLLEPGYHALSGAAFSADGRQVVTASLDGTARLWNAATGRQLTVITEPNLSPLNSAQLSPDGREILTAASDHTARVWNVSTGAPVVTFAAHTAAVASAAFSPNARNVVTASVDGTARVYTAVPLEQVAVLGGVSGKPLEWGAFNPSGGTIVAAGADAIGYIWSDHGQPGGYFRVGKEVISGSYSRDGRWLALAGLDGTAQVWSADAAGGRPLVALRIPRKVTVTGAVFSPDGKELVTSDAGKEVRIWSVSSGRELKAWQTGTLLLSVALSPDGKEIVTAGENGTAQIYSIDGSAIGVLPNRGGAALNDVAYSPDGQEIVTASADGTARVWSANTHKLRALLAGPGGAPLNSADFSPDGREIVTAGGDGTARIWSVTSQQLLTSFTAGSSGLNSASFSPDGREVLTTGNDGTARIWSAQLAGSLATVEQLARARVRRGLTASERATYLPSG
jgi:WD40 repeat protein